MNEREASGTVRLQGVEVHELKKYLGSTVQRDGECGKELKMCVMAGWSGWRKVSGGFCDKRVAAKVKRFRQGLVRPSVLHD